jgi:phage-related protein
VTDEDYNWQTIVAEINSLGQKYVNRNRAKLSQPSVNIRVTYRSELDRLSNVGFSDTVTVSYGPLKMIHTANVTRTVYDSLLERYNELQIGDKKMTLSSFIRSSLRR